MSIKDTVVPMGYLQLLPGFDNIPLIVIAGSDSINLLNLNDAHMEPLIIAESASAFG